jgi:peptidoglycan hydrolase-like protein with peptidoglycan-binding domain
VLVLLASLAILAPSLAFAVNDVVALDAKALTSAKVERNGKHVGTVQKVMVNPTTGQIAHVDILMTEGQQRTISVPWSGVKVYQDTAGNMTLSLTTRAASEASPSAGPRTSSSISTGSNDVLSAQQRLKDRGYYQGPLDGVIGPGTQAALRAYQRDRGLSMTGVVYSQTLHSLTGETAAATTSTPTATRVMDVDAAQRELRSRGYYSGPVDGVIGAGTEAALRAYQRDRGLKVTGQLDAPTARSLTS